MLTTGIPPPLISIHAPQHGERPRTKDIIAAMSHFNPRSPTRGATMIYYPLLSRISISIHAPQHGERRTTGANPTTSFLFQSTLPNTGSDMLDDSYSFSIFISIHAPQHGERQPLSLISLLFFNISIHAPQHGERQDEDECCTYIVEFQSTLPNTGSDELSSVIQSS